MNDQVIDFKMPSLGSDMDAGTVLRWRIDVGDTVRKGDVLLDVDTEKSEIEVEVWQDGVVAEILVPAGTEVPVGTTLAQLTVGPATGPAAATQATVEPQPTPAPIQRPAAAPLEIPDAPSEVGPWVPTPRLVYWPSPQSAAAMAPPRGPSPSQPRTERRQAAVATAMERSNRDIPHFHLVADIDLAPTRAWLDETNDQRSPPDRILLAAVLLRAVAVAATRHTTFNGSWVDGSFRPSEHIQLGVAVHLRGGGLMTPVLPDADEMSLDELMAGLRGLVGRARRGALRGQDVGDPTITVTNLGDGGADAVLGLIRPPQVALVGFGRMRDGVVAVEGAVEMRPVITATLSADHRANNGQSGSAFLATLAELVRDPEALAR